MRCRRSPAGRPRGAPVVAVLVAAFLLATFLLTGPAGPADADVRIAGNVVSVDAERSELLIDDAGHRETVLVPPGTPIVDGEKPRELKSLARGDRVVIALEEGTPLRARRINVAGPARVQRSNPLIRTP